MIRLAYNLGLNRDATPDEVKQRVDAQQTAEQLMRDIWTSQEHIDLLTRQDGQVKDLQSQVDDLAHKLNVVQALNGDATKWQTLKTLIKELVS
jgi:aconitase A